MPGPRYDFGIAFALSGAPSLADFARQVRVHRREIQRWAQGGLTHQAADRVACRLGWLPFALWPEWLRYEPSAEVTDWPALMRARKAVRAEEERRRRAEVRAFLEAFEAEERAFRREPRTCPTCGDTFTPRDARQVYDRMSCAERGRQEGVVAITPLAS